jgi:D-aminopeptidase
MPSLMTRVDRALETFARQYPGPGGACAVLRHGEVVIRHAWGWANAEQRIAFTPRTLFRMCSITKQFTCGVLLENFPDPSVLDADVRARLPLLVEPAPATLNLCHNQSGLRDYWAVAMLHGSPVEAPFGDLEAARVIGGSRTLQFRPGSRYSYTNQNFRLLSDILQERTGRGFGELLERDIFDRVGMHGARLTAETSAMPDGTQGYEGSPQTGYRAAVNNIFWTGDAGLGATLDDMIAWERHIDATRDDPDSLYRRLSAPVSFVDGAPARYGFGLARGRELDRDVIGHGGALRGWRSHRMVVPSERLSVVVMFNHLSDAHAAAVDLMAAVLGVERPARPTVAEVPSWIGTYVEPETGLAARIESSYPGQLQLRYGHSAERLDLRSDGSASNEGTVLSFSEGGLWMERLVDHQRSLLRPCSGDAAEDIAGRFHCAELDGEITIVDAGGVMFGAFSGFLGHGRMEMLHAAGPDLWMLPCPRALDHTPPGDWTLAFTRDPAGRVSGIEVGCWLARRLTYQRIDG